MHEYIIARQILKSGTSIVANCREARRAQSLPDFYAKLTIALKEADETSYWLDLLMETDYIDFDTYSRYSHDCNEHIKLLVSITKTVRCKIENKESVKL